MKKVTTLTVAAISAIAMLTGCSSTNEAIKKVDPVKFSEVIAQPGVNINIAGPDFASEVSKLEKDATVAVYCRSANRSAVATKEMADLGFTDMYDLQGGIIDWETAGRPVVK
jgi:phage shock protein E